MNSVIMMNMVVPLAVMLMILLPISTSALTTFGKTSPTNQNPPPPPIPVGVAKICKIEADCSGIANTTCVSDPKDGKTKCLCSDLTAPYNGACLHKPVNSVCKDDVECGPGAHCAQGNGTTSGKTCQCQYGYYEENMRCNGSLSLLQSSSSLVLLISLIFLRNLSYS